MCNKDLMIHQHLSPNLILVLAYLLKTKSVGTTAMMLGMSQPSVSRHLARLREVVQDPLLVRTGNRMARTGRGEELVDRLSDWVTATASLLDASTFDPTHLHRRFRIATTDFGAWAVCQPALPAMRQHAPSMGLDILPLGHAPHRKLAAGEIDLALTGFDPSPEQIHHDLLFEDSFICVTRKGHPLTEADDGAVDVDAFVAYPHLGLSVSDAELDRVAMELGAAARHRKVAMTIPYFTLAPQMLLAGDLVMVVPSRAARSWCDRPDLATRPAPAVLGTLKYWILWHERSRHDPAVTWLRTQLIRSASAPPGPGSGE
ncbi:transcriptional regulator, LysR family [Novosphingobium mathurense]|uniref:Transcriptional regulator, LysR family n=2 Tax=Novosphingobium mathurense TaxID=428990 RepID=A0A1U6IG01_9SPHN|nr:transcriptional regulator, LysR family [Novosphingobium mathurense]